MEPTITPISFITDSPQQTEILGKRLGSLLGPGDVITLSGELGGGKTCFVRGVVAATSPAALEMVASPTFAILNEYPGRPSILHYDCYRLRGSDDAFELGFEEQLSSSSICLIEWPERIQAILPDQRIDILFDYLDENRRRITLIAHGRRATEQLTSLVDH